MPGWAMTTRGLPAWAEAGGPVHPPGQGVADPPFIDAQPMIGAGLVEVPG